MTSGIRGNWIQALRSAAHLSDTDHRLSLGERLERQLADTARYGAYTIQGDKGGIRRQYRGIKGAQRHKTDGMKGSYRGGIWVVQG